MTQTPVIVNSLIKRYGGSSVVDGLSLRAEAGQVTAILGPNGAGKTTTVECCEGLRVPDGGSISILGHDPLDATPDQRARVGVMLQDGGLPSGSRAIELLRHVSRLYDTPRPVDELVAQLGIDSFGTTTVRRLSGGQRQRLALAIAILGRPDVVFLDEPSAGMDPQARVAVHDIISSLRADGVAVILTTHLMDEAQRLADQVYIVDHGQVIAEGTVDALLGDRTSSLRVHLPGQAPVDDVVMALSTALADGYAVSAAEDIIVIHGDVTADLVARATAITAQLEVLPQSVTVGQVSLEDVFLDLTGRTLR